MNPIAVTVLGGERGGVISLDHRASWKLNLRRDLKLITDPSAVC